MNVLILTNGEYGNYGFCQKDQQKGQAYDYIICADRGMEHAKKLDLKPDLIVGDFDSGSKEDLAYYEACHITIETFNPEKDETDTEIAIKRAVEKGATSITVYGGIGSRLDHSLANVHLLLPLLESGIRARLMNPNNTVYLVNDQIHLEGEKGDLVSLIPFSGPVVGVTTQHLAYALEDATLKMGSSLGVSNYMLREDARVAVKSGILIVIQSCD